MKKTPKIIWLFLLIIGVSGCKDELKEMHPAPQKPVVGIQFKGNMPADGKQTRAYIDGKGGFFWNSLDTIYVIDSYYNSFGAMFTANFGTSPESEGKKTAVFQYNLAEADPSDMTIYLMDHLLNKANDYYAFYPQPHSRGDDPKLGGYYEYHFPSTQTQEGTTSRHLSQYMLMTSGKVDIVRNEGSGLIQEDGYVKLPDFTLTHRTSLMRFRILNRQPNPVQVKRVSVSARRKDGNTSYFLPSCAYYVANDSVDLHTSGAYSTLSVQVKNNGTAYCTVPAQGEFTLNATLLPNSTEDVEFMFTVETTDAQYKTLAFSGNQIRNGKFEVGMYYTFELLLDHSLTVQSWEEDRLDAIQFGQEAFSVSANDLTIPLEGGHATLRIDATHPAGWTLAECPEWLETDITSAPQGTTNVLLTAEAATAERSGTICFIAGNLRKWITIRQTAVKEEKDDAINVTAEEMNAQENQRILQDDEPASIYCDKSVRSFNTAQPLQANVEDGQLHLRFYSPRKLEQVEIWAKIPGLSEEEFLLARFEEVAPFIDYYKELPFLTKDCTFRTASGKSVTVRQNPYFPDDMLSLRAVSYCEYWRRLQQIKHGWDISFSLFGGDPTKPDGGHTTNWMGIRPVHCREAVAVFLNLCYITDMKEHEELIRANENLLYGNGGTGDKVTAVLVLSQMKQERSIAIGLVWPGYAFGLGGPGVFGLYQKGWLEHYNSLSDCIIMFHELGHVLGYNHSSSFTNGPWAHELMSKFYLENLHRLPIDSPDYLNSKNNPNLYK